MTNDDQIVSLSPTACETMTIVPLPRHYVPTGLTWNYHFEGCLWNESYSQPAGAGLTVFGTYYPLVYSPVNGYPAYTNPHQPALRTYENQESLTAHRDVAEYVPIANLNSPLPSKSRRNKNTTGRATRHAFSKPALSRPLSELTKTMANVPIKDMHLWVHRPIEARREEAKLAGKVGRPINAFILYRSAYAEGAKRCAEEDHQNTISIITALSWNMETPDVRNKYDNLAQTEKAQHAKAHPTYRYTPAGSKTRRSSRPHRYLGRKVEHQKSQTDRLANDRLTQSSTSAHRTAVQDLPQWSENHDTTPSGLSTYYKFPQGVST